MAQGNHGFPVPTLVRPDVLSEWSAQAAGRTSPWEEHLKKMGKRLRALAAGFITSLFSKLIVGAPVYRGCGEMKQFPEDLQTALAKPSAEDWVLQRGGGRTKAGD